MTDLDDSCPCCGCQVPSLTAEIHARESVEAEFRETASALAEQKLHTIRAVIAHEADKGRLNEATALLAEVPSRFHGQPPFDRHPLPAAPVLCHPTDPCRHGITGPCSRCQPAAPEPLDDPSLWPFAVPRAAPEPSDVQSTRAELERANQKIIGAECLLLRASRCVELDDWRDDYDAWMSSNAAPATNGLLCYEGDCAKMTGRARPCPIHDAAPEPSAERFWQNAVSLWRGRAESAEAQLAAVREQLTGVHVMSSWDSGQVVCASVVEDALALLSPGGGTGGDK